MITMDTVPDEFNGMVSKGKAIVSYYCYLRIRAVRRPVSFQDDVENVQLVVSEDVFKWICGEICGKYRSYFDDLRSVVICY
ncbi:hypothetical protein CDAR_319381 [Caerostris darwini]|uniref:Uncharacterized protein n=1 Tax=Caerostris darwini TaxID=1538125 RepID=A0AAV4RGJ7_9ARAC|nr:hypothetical protein CDAR_319381 [Caerostris darwini]